jgi:hypothetical protein
MILGLSVQNFTIVHVVISLMAIASGIVVLIGMFGSRRLPGWTAFFLLMTTLTSLTGFLFPIRGFTPALGTGIVSCVLLALALYALYGKRLAGRMALDLRCHCLERILSQRAGPDRASVPEIAVPQAAGADPVRAAVPDRASYRAHCLPFRRHCRCA